MRTLLLAAHADDETLFAAYLAQKHAAHIAVVYDEGREGELAQATAWLGCSAIQLRAQKGMDPEVVETYLWGLHDPAGESDWARVLAPATHFQGHEEHNLVSDLAAMVFRDVEIIRYATYAPRGQRIHTPTEVHPERPEFIARKLAALACYRSQIIDPATRPWFSSLLDMREWVA